MTNETTTLSEGKIFLIVSRGTAERPYNTHSLLHISASAVVPTAVVSH